MEEGVVASKATMPRGERRRRNRRLCPTGLDGGGRDKKRMSYGRVDEDGPATGRQLVLAIEFESNERQGQANGVLIVELELRPG